MPEAEVAIVRPPVVQEEHRAAEATSSALRSAALAATASCRAVACSGDTVAFRQRLDSGILGAPGGTWECRYSVVSGEPFALLLASIKGERDVRGALAEAERLHNLALQS